VSGVGGTEGGADAPDRAFEIVGDDTAWQGIRGVSMGNLKVRTPAGDVVERIVMRHPGAVAALPLHDDGTVTLVRQYRSALDQDIWEIPAGLRDVEGEDLARTAERELVEEAGLRARSMRHLITFNNSPGISDEEVAIYLATGLEDVPDERHGPEEQHMLVRRMSLAEALAMVHDGRITDAKTIIALFMVG
jgi:8-oxo-dGTP pyrophosphatase MutT (NUDIX family)